MEKIHKTTSVVTSFSSHIAKGVMRHTGKTISNVSPSTGKYVEELGNAVVDTSTFTIDTLAKIVDATIQTGFDVKNRVPVRKSQGLMAMGNITVRIATGVGQSVIYTFQNSHKTINGIVRKDRMMVTDGLKNIGKIVVVGSVAIGFIDILNGSDTVAASDFSTRNDGLSGDVHPETGIPFEEKTVELPSGELREAAFPVFDSEFSVVLVEELYEASDAKHFGIANDLLYQAILENPTLRTEIGLSAHDINLLEMGKTPEGFVWHHSEDKGILQLVNEEVHHNTGHTGGRELWGGGTENR